MDRCSVFFLSRESTCTRVSFPCVYGRLRAVFCIVFLKNSWQYIQYSSSLRILSVTLCDVIFSRGWHSLCSISQMGHTVLFYLTAGTPYVVLRHTLCCSISQMEHSMLFYRTEHPVVFYTLYKMVHCMLLYISIGRNTLCSSIPYIGRTTLCCSIPYLGRNTLCCSIPYIGRNTVENMTMLRFIKNV